MLNGNPGAISSTTADSELSSRTSASSKGSLSEIRNLGGTGNSESTRNEARFGHNHWEMREKGRNLGDCPIFTFSSSSLSSGAIGGCGRYSSGISPFSKGMSSFPSGFGTKDHLESIGISDLALLFCSVLKISLGFTSGFNSLSFR
ncbi:hypothetical protein CEXT_753171 [Caerostris extrusa]|uniref:Uncharacterized protein n=1 Tax=Caerostris extrusa TaxID=172846 RepID=A0AAV4W1X8_CAEEX|nr:hypothetical protein CEXT_753171 [Caerostris extrusa]